MSEVFPMRVELSDTGRFISRNVYRDQWEKIG
jgi:hypothetical protein